MAKRVPIRIDVIDTEQISAHLVRLTFGGDGLAAFTPNGFTDAYVKLVFEPPGVVYPEPLDLDAVRETFPADQWPRLRTYTVRSFDAGRLVIDFVVHGDSGIAGPWAASAQVGDVRYLLGPGGDYAPDAAADWHLLVGDESALPAIAAALDALPADARAHVFVEVEGPDDEIDLARPATWLHRHGGPVGEDLVSAVTGLDEDFAGVHAFVHGEAGFVRDLRRHLRRERMVPLERLSVSGYWRLGKDDEAWRAVKRQWNEAIAAEESTQ